MRNTAVDLFAPARVTLERRSDGALLLESTARLGEHDLTMAHTFRAGAARHPERILAAERDGDGWHSITWGQARDGADALAAGLLALGLDAEHPLMVLSGNSVSHLLLALAAHTAGVPIMPVSTAYSLASSDHERIRAIVTLATPGAVFADDAAIYVAALDAAAAADAGAVIVGRGERPGAVTLDELMADGASEAVDLAFAGLGPDTIAKILFTSGSTGLPKGVINTHRMLTSNQRSIGQIWPFMREEPPVLVDWLPWSHTFGGNHNVNQVIAFGGTLYIDDGRPVPGPFERTIAALAEHPPTVYYNVPAGFALLAPRLEQDAELARTFFSRLRFMFYAGAALPDALFDRLRAVAERHADHDVPLTASWGTTETAPAATSAHFSSAPCGCIGVPMPGVTVKLVPDGQKLEIRLRGPNITPGYLRNPEATAAAFDEEGFYRTGDAVRLIDEDDPDQGLMFDGRLAEDFKLLTGTWVHVGKLRTALVSAASVLRDAVIAGSGREYVGALAWVDQAAARLVCGADADLALDDPRLHELLRDRLARLNAGAGSALRIERILLLGEPPDIDAGEITDKGYINQRAVLERRGSAVTELYDDRPGPTVIVAGRR
jgi:feruloyl-CoA synthase